MMRVLRTNSSLTQKDVAKIMSVTQTSVCQWETGAAYPHPSKIPKLAELYGVTPGDILAACNAAHEQRHRTA